MTAPDTIPDSAWVRIGDHRWATDGACMVREDGPRRLPGSVWSWRDGPAMVGEMSRVLGYPRLGCPHPGAFDSVYRPVIQAGEPVTLSTSPTLNVPLLGILRDGELVAVVMPLSRLPRADEGVNAINAKGESLSEIGRPVAADPVNRPCATPDCGRVANEARFCRACRSRAKWEREVGEGLRADLRAARIRYMRAEGEADESAIRMGEAESGLAAARVTIGELREELAGLRVDLENARFNLGRVTGERDRAMEATRRMLRAKEEIEAEAVELREDLNATEELAHHWQGLVESEGAANIHAKRLLRERVRVLERRVIATAIISAVLNVMLLGLALTGAL